MQRQWRQLSRPRQYQRSRPRPHPSPWKLQRSWMGAGPRHCISFGCSLLTALASEIPAFSGTQVAGVLLVNQRAFSDLGIGDWR